MKTIKAEINLYSYEELKEEAKEKAFNEHKEFLDNLGEEYENEKGELIKEYREHEFEEVEESLRINEYLFFENGEMAHIIHFTGKHKKAGTTEFYFNGKTYVLD
jgi:hypothetical protein